MATPSSNAEGKSPSARHTPKHACSLCARRKVKCDRRMPCVNCIKAETDCTYEPVKLPRPRKRAADDDLLSRIQRYENLMREHGVDFTEQSYVWTSPDPDVKGLQQKPQTKTTRGYAAEKDPVLEISLWSRLAPELKFPAKQSLYHKDDPSLCPSPTLLAVMSTTKRSSHHNHPEPKHMYRLWQIFLERVNPLLKIIHVPTMQQRVSEASWDAVNIPEPLAALLFAVYSLAVVSLSPTECENLFDETRSVLTERYRAAALRALVEAEFLTTARLDVLQAFVLFLLGDPESDQSCTLAGSALRIGLRMGLHRDTTDPKLSFFEREMRIRLWWQLRSLADRSIIASTPGMTAQLVEFGDIRLPLNVNDADLHVDMVECPVESSGPTEMVCVLTKLAIPQWLKSSAKALKVFTGIFQGPAISWETVDEQDRAVNELANFCETQFLRSLDTRIPLHKLARTLADLAIARLRFKGHHPRTKKMDEHGNVLQSRAESDVVFEAAVSSLRLANESLRAPFCSHLCTHLTSIFFLDAYIYVLSELRRRVYGDEVEFAWSLVEDLFTEHPELIDNSTDRLSMAICELTLEAWKHRRDELIQRRAYRDLPVAPRFIEMLEKRPQAGAELSVPSFTGFDSGNGVNWGDMIDFNWQGWTDTVGL